MKIGVLGLGTIATAVVEGMVADGHDIVVSRRGAANAARLQAAHGLRVADNQDVVDASDVLFLGLTDDVAAQVLSGLRFREGQRVVSLMAGAGLAELAQQVAPAQAVARMIPFPSIAQGGSQVLALGDCVLIRDLFGARNSVFELASEAELRDYLCAQAVLSPAVRMVKEAADWLAETGANPDTAETFLRELVGTSLLAGPCGPLLTALDTPGGYNQRLREHMVQAGMPEALRDGLEQLRS